MTFSLTQGAELIGGYSCKPSLMRPARPRARRRHGRGTPGTVDQHGGTPASRPAGEPRLTAARAGGAGASLSSLSGFDGKHLCQALKAAAGLRMMMHCHGTLGRSTLRE